MATPVSRTDGGEGSSSERGESSGTANAVAQRLADISLVRPPRRPSNWGSVVKTLNLYVAGTNFPEIEIKNGETGKTEMRPCFNLDDLMESLQMISVYGAGVPFTMDGTPMIRYYNPSLSGIGIYLNSSDPQTWIRGSEMKSAGVTGSVTSPEKKLLAAETESPRKVLTTDFAYSAVSSSPSNVEVEGEGIKWIEYIDRDLPFNRPTLSDQLRMLATQHPELSKLTSIDLHPSSWIAVAWYTSYEIPSGLSLKKSETAFLTFHFLSTRVKFNPPHEVLPAPDTSDKNFNIFMIPPATLKLTLPAFGLATYKIRGTHLAPTEPHEIEQETNLWLAADNWLTSLKVPLKDFQFFQSAYRRLG